MLNFTNKFLKHFLRLTSSILICAGLVGFGLAGLVAPAYAAGKEPIAYIGHGAMFDQNGREMAPSIKFIRETQAWYRSELLGKLSQKQRAEFDKFEQGLTRDLTLDAQSRLVLNTSVLDWLINATKVENADLIRGKNNLIKALLKTKLSENSDIKRPWSTEPFNINQGLLNRLKDAESNSPSAGSVQLLTNTSGAAYRAECLANGVPIPPDIGNPAWVSRGEIPQAELFISAGLKAEVLTYQSTSPPGMCVALPRFDGSNTVQLDGVICLGKTNSNACFWDNEKNGTQFMFQRGTSKPFSDFGGGTELRASVGGTCTDCHAGENPYIIHDNLLGSLESLGLPIFANSWHKPIVGTATPPWPENPGPMNAPASCVGCHIQGIAGRFPHLSTALPGYCQSVLALSIARTMPPGSPGSLAGTPEMMALQNWCGLTANGDAAGRGDPHITTFDRVNYDFQSAGEFVYLRDADGLEIQTRQTPIATTSNPRANPHTGLSSCVSVDTAVAARVGKHRVSYQPTITEGSEQHSLALRVDGKLTKLDKQGINLGDGGQIVKSVIGNGIEIFFPDKTHLIATPNWWSSQNTWYMNVDVVNTPGREGVMGAIPPGSWLPLLPNGTTMGARPASLRKRYVDLNQKFASAWRVDNSNSLFDYPSGTSTATFTDRNWPPEKPPCMIPDSKIPPAEPMQSEKAQELCRDLVDKNIKSQCVFDVTVTGEAGFAKTYLTTQALQSSQKQGYIK